MRVRQSTIEDIPALKAIADANRPTLGFLMRSAFAESVVARWVLVAERDSRLLGFVRYRHRRNEQTTIYELCVAQDYRGQGIGRLLIEALAQEAQERGKSHIQLKAVTGIAANGFYEHLGFALIGVETGKKRALNVWRLYHGNHILRGA